MPLLTHDKKKQVIERTKALLSDILFKNRHRINSKFFTRERKLTFTLVMLLILQKAVNKAVSFNAIKNHVIELFHKEEDTETILDKLTQLFKTNPICVRDDRKIPREKSNLRRLLNYHKRRKKICL